MRLATRWPASISIGWRYRTRTWLPLLLAAGTLVLLGLWGPRRTTPPDDLATYQGHVFQVVRVLDGDTFDINVPDGRHATTRVRLWGVDTPEIASQRGPAVHFGREASKFAREWLAGGSVRLVLHPAQTRGKYGRLLAYAYVCPDSAQEDDRAGSSEVIDSADGAGSVAWQGCDGSAGWRCEEPVMFNLVLIKRGFAYADHRFDHPYQGRFKDAERRSRRQRVGLWAGVTLEGMPKWRHRYEQWRESQTPGDRTPIP